MFYYLQLKGRLPEPQVRFYAAQILLALEHLHGSNVIYRDLKPENILISKDGYLRLTDFGLSKESESRGAATSTFCGTSEYLAPEMVLGKAYTECVDWWEFGILIYEMLIGHAPFRSQQLQDLFQRIINDPVVFPCATHPSPECMEIVQLLLAKDPAERLSNPNVIKQHAWFRGLNWDDLYLKRLTPPYVPHLANPEDISHFNSDWVNPSEKLADAPPVPDSENPFKDFTFVK